MKFKVGDKVTNNFNKSGVVQEVFPNGCFVNYGDMALYEFNHDLKITKKTNKYITLNEVDKSAELEKQAQNDTERLVKEFCDNLAKVGKK